MPDYRHDLRFGINLVPSAQQVDGVIALARLTEQVGLEYVTFQDHPYNNTFVDAWTLITWIAAQTSEIRIAPNVLNVPLRPPAMLARSVASLQLLSNSRFELALGAGAFWDPIVAMGGPRRTPGEARRALSEAIDIIRQVNAGTRGGVRYEGEFYQVHGMRPGPEYAGDLQIWLGAYKPRMLKLLAEKGDAWLPSMGYIQISELADGNARIDDAAVGAGRQPEDIRRMLNISGSFLRADRDFLAGTPATWAEQLAELTLRDGISTYLFGTADPNDIQTFGEEVAPLVRELVAKERGEPVPERKRPESLTRIPSASGATRNAAIDYDSIPVVLQKNSIAPDQPGYDRVRSVYMKEGTPGLVLMTASADEVAEGLQYARKQPVPLSLRAGGHGTNGLSTNEGGIILDISRINDITVVNEAERIVRIGTGATWGMVAQELAPLGWSISSGDFGDVGVGGIATAGGIGLMARKYGLTIDSITAAEIVLADGTLLRTSQTEHPDLFWGIRGAGANLGVVTHVEIQAHPVQNIIVGQFTWDASDLRSFLTNWGAFWRQAPRELQAFLYFMPRRRGSGATMQALTMWSNEDADAAVEALTPLLEIAPVQQQGAQLVPYAAVVSPSNQTHSGQQTLRGHSGLLEAYDEATIDALVRTLGEGKVAWANFRHVGGAVNDMPADATAYAHRTQTVLVSAFDVYPDLRKVDVAWRHIAPFVTGNYINLESVVNERITREAYPSPTYERIQRLKTEYDPENVFNRNVNIPPVRG